MKKAGRKPQLNSISKNAKRQTFYLTPSLIEKINKVTSEKKINKSEFVNMALDNFILRYNKNLKKGKYRVVSLFTGCGGMDLGFKGNFKFLNKHYRTLGFETVFANDIIPDAKKTYEAHFGKQMILGDIKKYLDDGGDIPDCEVLIGGFPCQDFSVAGKRKGLSSERGRLYEQMKRIIMMKQPMIFIAENVKGLTNMGDALERIKKDFSSIYPGYNITHFLKMAADFGVPQTRERVFIVGIRKSNNLLNNNDISYIPPSETHSADEHEGRKLWVTSEKAISDLENKTNTIPNQDQVSKAKRYGPHCQGNKAIRRDYPGPTIRAQHHGNIEFHYNNKRRLTVRECARIQSFPDNFEFKGSASKNYVLIGNAVPPVLGWHIAKSVKEYLDNVSKKS